MAAGLPCQREAGRRLTGATMVVLFDALGYDRVGDPDALESDGCEAWCPRCPNSRSWAPTVRIYPGAALCTSCGWTATLQGLRALVAANLVALSRVCSMVTQ